MNALVYDHGLRLLTDAPMPRAEAGCALIRVRLAGICGTDLEITRGYKQYAGILGHEFVGDVVQCDDPTWLGKRVCGEINITCGECDRCLKGMGTHCRRRAVLGILDHPGAFAEYLALPVENLHVVPAGVSDEEAVFVEPLAAACEILEQVTVQPDQPVIVLGDGRLGNLCAQILAAAGARVTVIGRHPEKLVLLEARGIATSRQAGLVEECDLVVEATGSSAGVSDALNLVCPRGTLILKSTVVEPIQVDMSAVVVNELFLIGSRCGPFQPALDALASHAVDVRPLIHERLALRDGLEAMRRAGEPGVLKVLIEMDT